MPHIGIFFIQTHLYDEEYWAKECFSVFLLEERVVVQSLSHVQPFVTPWTAAHWASLSLTVSWSYSNSCPLSPGCYLTISSSTTLFSFCLQSFPASGSCPMSWLFISGSQSTRALASVLPRIFRIDFL